MGRLNWVQGYVNTAPDEFSTRNETFTADTVYTGPFNFFGSVHTEL